jgi:hypothetical protein
LERFENSKFNIQHTWREIKNILYEGKNTLPINKINDNGKITTNLDNITNTFNEYFANIGPSLATKIVKVDGNRYINEVRDSMVLLPTDKSEVCKIIKSLSGNKANGHDEVSASLQGLCSTR